MTPSPGGPSQLSPCPCVYSSAQVCQGCKREFEEAERKHHCRSCGEGFCQPCSSHRMPVPERGWGVAPVRVCQTCHRHGGPSDTGTQVSKAEPRGLMARRVTEVAQSTLDMVTNAVDYPLCFVKGMARQSTGSPTRISPSATSAPRASTPAMSKHHCRPCGQGVCGPCSTGAASSSRRSSCPSSLYLTTPLLHPPLSHFPPRPLRPPRRELVRRRSSSARSLSPLRREPSSPPSGASCSHLTLVPCRVSPLAASLLAQSPPPARTRSPPPLIAYAASSSSRLLLPLSSPPPLRPSSQLTCTCTLPRWG
ncbi:unnamed protein product [Arctogadus glacialis]